MRGQLLPRGRLQATTGAMEAVICMKNFRKGIVEDLKGDIDV